MVICCVLTCPDINMVHYARALHFSQTHQGFFFPAAETQNEGRTQKNNNKYSATDQIWSWRTKRSIILQKVGTFFKLYSLKHVLMTLIHSGFLKDSSTQSESCRVLNLCPLSCRLVPLCSGHPHFHDAPVGQNHAGSQTSTQHETPCTLLYPNREKKEWKQSWLKG